MAVRDWKVLYENRKTKATKSVIVQAESVQGATFAAKQAAGSNWRVKSVTPA